MITVESKRFKALLAHSKRAVDSKSTMPILAAVLMEAKDGRLTIIGTDLERRLVLDVPCAGELPAVAVDLKRLLLVLDGKTKGPAKDVEMSVSFKEPPDTRRCKAPWPGKVVPGSSGYRALPDDEHPYCREPYEHEGHHECFANGDTQVWEGGPSLVQAPLPLEPMFNVAVGARKFALTAWRAAEFPAAQEIGAAIGSVVTYPLETLLRVIDYCGAAISTDETRAHLCGVWFGGKRACGCNGGRLHVVEKLPAVGSSNVMLPGPSVGCLRGLIGATSDPVQLQVYEAPGKGGIAYWLVDIGADSRAMLSSTWPGDEKCVMPEIDQVVPDPARATVKVTADRDALSEAFVLGGKVANRNHNVRVSINGVFKVSATDDDGSDVVEEIPAEFSGELDTALHAPYVVEALDGLSSAFGKVTIYAALSTGATPTLGPLLFTAGGSCYAVVMPTRL